MFYTAATAVTPPPPPAGPAPHAPGVWGTFPDPALERRFRRDCAAGDRQAFRLVLQVAFVGWVVFVSNDFSQPDALPTLLGIRVTFLAATAAVLWRLRRPVPPRLFDRLGLGWTLLFAAGNLAIQLVRPPAHLGHAVTTVCVVMLTYGVVPLPVRVQAGVAVLHSLCWLAIAAWVKPAGAPEYLRAMAFGLVFGNVLGCLTARLLHARARRLFLALDRQAELSAALEKSLAEVRTLRGLIRICAWCKHVHADGEWQQIEKYVSANSHAAFTHGICPACLVKETGRHAGDSVSRFQ